MTNKEYNEFLNKVNEMIKDYCGHIIENEGIFIHYKIDGNRLRNTTIYLSKEKPAKQEEEIIFVYIRFENEKLASKIINNVNSYTGKIALYNTIENLYWELDTILNICCEEPKIRDLVG